MSARPEQNPATELDAFIRDAEFQVLRRLAKLTESENERVALRACEVVLRYVAQRRSNEAQATSASGGRKPPEGAPNGVSDKPLDVSDKPSNVSGSPSGGLRPPLAEGRKVPAALLHPPKPKPAFRAVPLDKLDAVAHLFGEPSVPPVLSKT